MRPSHIAGLVAVALLLSACGGEPQSTPERSAPARPPAAEDPLPGPIPTRTTSAPDPEPASVPEPTLESQRSDRGALSGAELAGTRILVAFRGPDPPPALIRAIRDRGIAGVILYGDNVAGGVAATRRLTERLQRARGPGDDEPLVIAIDQEGGLVRRLRDSPPAMSAVELGRLGPEAVRRSGEATGAALRDGGLNVDLAPVADVPGAGSAMLRERRTFGADTRTVATGASAFARGLRSAGVIATAKHFPGFGAATANSDVAPVRIDLSRVALRDREGPSFARVIDAGAGLVMLSNAVYPAFDPDRPATLSRVIAQDELRGRVSFDGVCITDDLGARALRRFGGPGRLAVGAVDAGCDLLLFGQAWPDPLAAAAEGRRAVRSALRSGRLDRDEALVSVGRIARLRRLLAR